MSYQSVKDIIDICEEKNIEFWEAVLQDDMDERDVSAEQSLADMKRMWEAMKSSIAAYDPEMVSRSGMVGPEGGLMDNYRAKGETLCGDFVSGVIARALKMGACNACMKQIVAAPTAGACGVIPAVLVACYEEYDLSEDTMIHALYTAAGIGQVIAARAFIAGAAGGCQAEVGSASGMAAAALAGLKGGTPQQMGDACAIALKNLLGLVCDPVAGLVEVPCVKRNVIGSVNALSAADMVLAGIKSTIPVDQVIDTMREVGESLPESLRETSHGGLAVTERAKEIVNSLNL